MPSPISALQRERLKLYGRILAASALIGALYGAALAPKGIAAWASVAVGVLNGIAIAGCIGAIEIFLLREGASLKRLLQLPFVAVVALKTAVYAGIVSAFIVFMPRLGHLTPLAPRAALITIGFSLAMTLIFVIVLQVAGLLGRRTVSYRRCSAPPPSRWPPAAARSTSTSATKSWSPGPNQRAVATLGRCAATS
jgi:hypothetical protein